MAVTHLCPAATSASPRRWALKQLHAQIHPGTGLALRVASFMLERNFPMDTEPMKFLPPLLLLFPLCALADDKDYDQCILDNQRMAKSGVAVHFITQACDKLYNDGSFLLSREKVYYECLLENLPGVENNLAAQKIRSACESKSQD
ncbi:hypothetical protein NOX75_17970 [Pseudomonas aeruginosa]|nr:hypothetical protein [Pseudomonas aeruginosa]MCW8034560.1 hypothetical protein [Pseudomonas aeruginosa]